MNAQTADQTGNGMTRKVRVVLADDHPILRTGLKMLLEAAGDIEVVAEVGDGVEAIRAARDLSPDLFVLDVNMPRVDGLTATTEIRRILPRSRILVLSMNDEDEFLYKSVKAGGNGYVHKRSAQEELLLAVREVMRGGTYMREATKSRMLADAFDRWDGDPDATPEDLTPREKEVLKLIVSGLTNQ